MTNVMAFQQQNSQTHADWNSFANRILFRHPPLAKSRKEPNSPNLIL